MSDLLKYVLYKSVWNFACTGEEGEEEKQYIWKHMETFVSVADWSAVAYAEKRVLTIAEETILDAQCLNAEDLMPSAIKPTYRLYRGEDNSGPVIAELQIGLKVTTKLDIEAFPSD